MTTEERLQKAQKLNDEVEELKYAKEEAFDSACDITAHMEDEKVQTSKENSFERRLIAYADYSKLLDERIFELICYRTEILRRINMIEDTNLRTLLIARYINCKTWEQIAEDMGYSDKWVRTSLHKRALAEAEKCFS